MRTILYLAIVVVAMAVAGCHSTKESTRDLAYEQYCDSIWESDPDYYLDVIMESDQYCEYIEINGKWW